MVVSTWLYDDFGKPMHETDDDDFEQESLDDSDDDGDCETWTQSHATQMNMKKNVFWLIHWQKSYFSSVSYMAVPANLGGIVSLSRQSNRLFVLLRRQSNEWIYLT